MYSKVVESTVYTHSSAKIKVLDNISEKIKILCETEQGHSISPELFKCFIYQLSEDLNNLESIEVPILNSVADDLILLALDAESLRSILSVPYTFCQEWDLSVNNDKTAVVVFNRKGRLLNDSRTFFLMVYIFRFNRCSKNR